MTKAILIIDDIDEQLFTETLSIKYQLIYYPDGHMKELGRHGKRRLRPMPEKKEVKEIKHLKDFVDMETQYDYIVNRIVGKINYDVETIFNEGYNSCLDEIIGGEDV